MGAHPEMLSYLVLFVSGAILVIFLTPFTITLAKRIGAMDYPDPRKIHTAPIPRLGGLAIAISVAITMALGYASNTYIRNGIPAARGAIVGVVIILILGVYDDVRNAPATLKLVVQIIAAGIAVMLGVRFELASNPMAEHVRNHLILGPLSVPLTILWIVGLTNAMNLIDGLDGLATGISMFASIALFLISLQQSAGLVTYFYAAVSGATFAFLKFGRHPASVFLGDCGATFLGFLLACLSVMGTQKSYTLAAMLIPLIVFGVPVFDAIVTLVRRYLHREKMFDADRQHLHHRLLSFGLNQRQTVLILYVISIVFGIIGFAFTVLLDEYAAVILGIFGILGGFAAKELHLIGPKRPPMEREFRYREKKKSE